MIDRQTLSAPRPALPGADDRGFAMVGLIVLLVPMMLLVGSFLQTMSGRQSRLELEIHEEQAMMATEAGIDLALNAARRGTLVAGPAAVYEFSGTLPIGSSFRVRCVYLGGDGENNDVDTPTPLIDVPADPDEDCFRVICSGYSGESERRVAAYLGFSSYIPTLTGTVTVMGTSTDIDIDGSAVLSGEDTDMNGTPTGAGSTYGLSIMSPGTTADLLSTLTPAEQTQIEGLGGSPSLGTAATIDLDAILDYARNSASIIFTNTNLSAGTYGTEPAPVVCYRLGDLRIQGNVSGYGVMVIEGNVDLVGTIAWNGILVITGNLDAGSGTARVNGAVLIGPDCTDLIMRGTIDLNYSNQAITMASGLVGRYFAFNGWQEITTNN